MTFIFIEPLHLFLCLCLLLQPHTSLVHPPSSSPRRTAGSYHLKGKTTWCFLITFTTLMILNRVGSVLLVFHFFFPFYMPPASPRPLQVQSLLLPPRLSLLHVHVFPSWPSGLSPYLISLISPPPTLLFAFSLRLLPLLPVPLPRLHCFSSPRPFPPSVRHYSPLPPTPLSLSPLPSLGSCDVIAYVTAVGAALENPQPLNYFAIEHYFVWQCFATVWVGVGGTCIFAFIKKKDCCFNVGGENIFVISLSCCITFVCAS